MDLVYAVYLIKCLTPNHYYIGWGSDTVRRWKAHRRGSGAKFTRKHGVDECSILCKTDSITVADNREKLYTILLQRENPTWVVSCGAPIRRVSRVLRKFGQIL
jgi:predicted GIY-YIG superfamily endonuclease